VKNEPVVWNLLQRLVEHPAHSSQRFFLLDIIGFAPCENVMVKLQMPRGYCGFGGPLQERRQPHQIKCRDRRQEHGIVWLQSDGAKQLVASPSESFETA
jgi:hypothetical protein